MTIATTIAALQAKHLTIAGIVSAPTAMPASIDTAKLPMALTIPGEAEWETEAVGLRKQTRRYIVRVFVEPTGQGKGVDEGFQIAIPILQAMGQAYLDDPTLTAAITHFGTIRDLGMDGRLMFAGQSYRGFEFQVDVVEKW